MNISLARNTYTKTRLKKQQQSAVQQSETGISLHHGSAIDRPSEIPRTIREFRIKKLERGL